jgi:hypothetical protein
VIDTLRYLLPGPIHTLSLAQLATAQVRISDTANGLWLALCHANRIDPNASTTLAMRAIREEYDALLAAGIVAEAYWWARLGDRGDIEPESAPCVAKARARLCVADPAVLAPVVVLTPVQLDVERRGVLADAAAAK